MIHKDKAVPSHVHDVFSSYVGETRLSAGAFSKLNQVHLGYFDPALCCSLINVLFFCGDLTGVLAKLIH